VLLVISACWALARLWPALDKAHSLSPHSCRPHLGIFIVQTVHSMTFQMIINGMGIYISTRFSSKQLRECVELMSYLTVCSFCVLFCTMVPCNYPSSVLPCVISQLPQLRIAQISICGHRSGHSWQILQQAHSVFSTVGNQIILPLMWVSCSRRQPLPIY
jgi:hypothetical protein